MSLKYLTNIDLNNNELQNSVIQNLATAPSSPKKGQIYFNTASNKAFVYNGTAWVPWEADTTVSPATANPLMDGTAAVGTSAKYAREDHKHPSDTTKADKSATVSTVAYDSTNKKITKTINGTTSDVVTVATLKTALNLAKGDVGLGNVDNTADASKSVASAATLTTARNIDGISFNGSANIHHYGTCGTAAATAAKVATIDGETFTLAAGAMVFIKMTYANGVANPTLNVNSTGAKSIKRYGTTAPSTTAKTSWQAGSVVGFVYDGSYWQMIGWLNDDSTYTAASASPQMDGTAAVGTSAKYAREDHVHPTDTSRASASDLSSLTTRVTNLEGSSMTEDDVDAMLADYVPITQKGAANGVASLDANGLVPSSQLPSYVDDVLEYASQSNFPTTGEAGKIYVAQDTNKTYRWSGTAYVEISASLALGETSSTAYRGDRGKTAYDHAAAKGSAFSSGLYKITTNAHGHVTAATAVEKSDITALGIPAQDTTYSSKAAASGGTDVSLVTTGEKYTWNNKASTDTKNTAGSTDSSSKLFLIGATSQAANPQTYSQDTVYAGTDGHIYSNGKQAVNLSDIQALTNKTYNGYTLGAACAKGVDTSVSATSDDLPTSGAVNNLFKSNKYVVNNPALTPSGGVCSWVITHNLGYDAPIVQIYENGTGNMQQVMADVVVDDENQITIKMISSANITASKYLAVIEGVYSSVGA